MQLDQTAKAKPNIELDQTAKKNHKWRYTKHQNQNCIWS